MSTNSSLTETVVRSPSGKLPVTIETKHPLSWWGNSGTKLSSVQTAAITQQKPDASIVPALQTREQVSSSLPDVQIVRTLLGNTENERDQLREHLDNVISNSDEHEKPLEKALQWAQDELQRAQDDNAKLRNRISELVYQRRDDQLKLQNLSGEFAVKDDELKVAYRQTNDLRSGNQKLRFTNRQLNKEVEKLKAELSAKHAEPPGPRQDKAHELMVEEYERFLNEHTKLAQDCEAQKSTILRQKCVIEERDCTINEHRSETAVKARKFRIGKCSFKTANLVARMKGLHSSESTAMQSVASGTPSQEKRTLGSSCETVADQNNSAFSARLPVKTKKGIQSPPVPLKIDCQGSVAAPIPKDKLDHSIGDRPLHESGRTHSSLILPEDSNHPDRELHDSMLAVKGKNKSVRNNLSRLMKSFTLGRTNEASNAKPQVAAIRLENAAPPIARNGNILSEKSDSALWTSPKQCTVGEQGDEEVPRLKRLKSMPKTSMKLVNGVVCLGKESNQGQIDHLQIVSETQSEPECNKKSFDKVQDQLSEQSNSEQVLLEHAQQNELGGQKPDKQGHKSTISSSSVHAGPSISVTKKKSILHNPGSICSKELRDLILQAYRDDKGMQAILHTFKQGNPGDCTVVRRGLGPVDAKRLEVANGLIYHTDVYGRVLCLPKNGPLTHRIVQHVHESPAEGHANLISTFECLRKQYFWPGIGGVVAAYVGACLVCKETNVSEQAVQLLSPCTLPRPLPTSSNTGTKRAPPITIPPKPPTVVPPDYKVTSVKLANNPRANAIISHECLEKIQHVEAIIQYTFTDKHLIWEALQADGNGVKASGHRLIPDGNKRLAQVGDKVLDLMIVWKGYEDGLPMHEIVDMTYAIASNANLIHVCIEKGLYKHINGKKKTEYIKFKADAIEAIIGAVALDSRTDLHVMRKVLDFLGLK